MPVNIAIRRSGHATGIRRGCYGCRYTPGMAFTMPDEWLYGG